MGGTSGGTGRDIGLHGHGGQITDPRGFENPQSGQGD
jgi:hypothetical protein